MGIKGLTSLLRRSQSSQALLVNFDLRVNDDEGIEEEQPSSSSSSQPDVALSRVAVDALAVLFFLSREESPSFTTALLQWYHRSNPSPVSSRMLQPPEEPALVALLLPDYRRLEVLVEAFVALGQAANLSFVWYFDGGKSGGQNWKESESESRFRQQAAEAGLLLAVLEGKVVAPTLGGAAKQMPLAVRTGRQTLAKLGQSIVQCVGEADFALHRDACDPLQQFDAVLSNDSDFFFAPHGAYYFLPLSSLSFDPQLRGLSCQLWDAQISFRALESGCQMPADSVHPVHGPWKVSALMGNDYTHHHKQRFSHLTVSLQDILKIAASPDESFPLPFDELMAANPDMAEAFAFTKRVYLDPASVILGIRDDIQAEENDGVIFSNVVSGRWPPTLLHTCMLGSPSFRSSALVESPASPPSAAITMVLQLIIMRLAGLSSQDTITMEVAVGGGKQTSIDLSTSSLSPLVLAHPFTPASTISSLLSTACITILPFHDDINNQSSSLSIQTVQLSINGKLSGFLPKLMRAFPHRSAHDLVMVVHIFLYFVHSSAFYNDPLTSRELLAFVMMALNCLARSESPLTQDAETPALISSLSLRAVSLLARFQSVMSAIFSLFHLLLEQDFVSPSPCAFFDARFFINLLKPEVSIPQPDDPLLAVASKFVALLSFHLPTPRSSSSFALPLSNTSSTSSSASPSTPSSTEDNAADFLEDEDEILWKGFSPQQMETLPIDAHAEKITDAIRTNHVVILTAETGSGKSSRVPQMILRDHDPERDGRVLPLILITQPRRIAATSLATRVAQELGEASLGGTVGYAIGQSKVGDMHRCRIMFVTTGWLVSKLLHDKSFFWKCTHVIVDEVHERSIHSDLLLLIIREYIREQQHRAPKIIAMSATIESQMLCDYFACLQMAPIPFLTVGTQHHPIEQVFLEELSSYRLFHHNRKIREALTALRTYFDASSNPLPYHSTSSIFSSVEIAIVQMVTEIATQQLKRPTESSCVLIFLPGVSFIESLFQKLDTALKDEQLDEALAASLEILVLHGLVEKADQQRVFIPLAPGMTRVVLATNVAESSVTIPFVRYVIDLGMHRSVSHSPKERRTLLVTEWISQSNVKQRRGRTGRMCPGVHFCLFTHRLHESMLAFAIPEMLRVSLAAAVLSLKMLSRDLDPQSVFANPRKALALAIQPPDSEDVVDAIEELFDYNILLNPSASVSSVDPGLDDQDLDVKLAHAQVSRFGELCHSIPLDFALSKLILFGARSGRFINHAVIIAVGMSMPDLFVRPYPFAKDLENYFSCLESTSLGRQKISGQDFSDALLPLRLYLLSQSPRAISELISYCVHLPRLKVLKHTVDEISRILQPLLPTHHRWLSELRSSSSTILRLQPEDLPFCRLMIAATLIPHHGFLRGQFPGPLQSKKPKQPGSSSSDETASSVSCLELIIPSLLVSDFAHQLKDVLPTFPPFLAALDLGNASNALTQKLQARISSQLFGTQKNQRSPDASILSQPHSTIKLNFTSLDRPREPCAISQLPFPIRVLDASFGSPQSIVMRFPRSPETISAEQTLESLFSFSSRSQLKPELPKPPVGPHLLFRTGSFQTCWSLHDPNGKKTNCKVDGSSQLSYLCPTSPASDVLLLAVPSSVQFTLRAGQLTSNCAQPTLLSGDPLFSALIMLLMATISSSPDHVESVTLLGTKMSLGLSVRPSFFEQELWQQVQPLFAHDGGLLFLQDSTDPLDILSVQTLNALLDLLRQHSLTNAPLSFPPPAPLSDAERTTLALCIASLCESQNNRPLRIGDLQLQLDSRFPIQHPFCSDDRVAREILTDIISQFNSAFSLTKAGEICFAGPNRLDPKLRARIAHLASARPQRSSGSSRPMRSFATAHQPKIDPQHVPESQRRDTGLSPSYHSPTAKTQSFPLSDRSSTESSSLHTSLLLSSLIFASRSGKSMYRCPICKFLISLNLRMFKKHIRDYHSHDGVKFRQNTISFLRPRPSASPTDSASRHVELNPVEPSALSNQIASPCEKPAEIPNVPTKASLPAVQSTASPPAASSSSDSTVLTAWVQVSLPLPDLLRLSKKGKPMYLCPICDSLVYRTLTTFRNHFDAKHQDRNVSISEEAIFYLIPQSFAAISLPVEQSAMKTDQAEIPTVSTCSAAAQPAVPMIAAPSLAPISSRVQIHTLLSNTTKKESPQQQQPPSSGPPALLALQERSPRLYPSSFLQWVDPSDGKQKFSCPVCFDSRVSWHVMRRHCLKAHRTTGIFASDDAIFFLTTDNLNNAGQSGSALSRGSSFSSLSSLIRGPAALLAFQRPPGIYPSAILEWVDPNGGKRKYACPLCLQRSPTWRSMTVHAVKMHKSSRVFASKDAIYLHSDANLSILASPPPS